MFIFPLVSSNVDTSNIYNYSHILDDVSHLIVLYSLFVILFIPLWMSCDYFLPFYKIYLFFIFTDFFGNLTICNKFWFILYERFAKRFPFLELCSKPYFTSESIEASLGEKYIRKASWYFLWYKTTSDMCDSVPTF